MSEQWRAEPHDTMQRPCAWVVLKHIWNAMTAEEAITKALGPSEDREHLQQRVAHFSSDLALEEAAGRRFREEAEAREAALKIQIIGLEAEYRDNAAWITQAKSREAALVEALEGIMPFADDATKTAWDRAVAALASVKEGK